MSEKSLAFSRECFTDPKLDYRVLDLEEIAALGTDQFDFIYSSNVLEHVPNVQRFLRGAWQVLRSNGTMLIAVPPITDEELRAANLGNPYHLNIWSPLQWHHTLSQYFSEVECYRHNFDRKDVG